MGAPAVVAMAKPPERLSGLVERVTFHNEESGFCVLRLRVRGFRDLVTLVGCAPSVSAGEYAAATGFWITDKQYGRQFRADKLSIMPPTTVEGIEKYLGSGMVKGIGPVYASRLVKAFGEKVFDVIEQDPGKLAEVAGIGPKRIAKIAAGWADQKVIREIMVFLHSHGVSTARAVRIYRTYGADAVSIVRSNPYRLAQDIRGIGFVSADKIAKEVGIEPESPLRAQAGVVYTLSEVSGSEGHCCLPRTDLIAKAVELLGIPEKVISEAIDHEIAEKRLVEDSKPSDGCVYFAPLYAAEVQITSRLRAVASSPLPWRRINAAKAVPWAEDRLGVTLAESQRRAVELALSSKMLVITGGPGVGKTTLVRAILTILNGIRVKTLLCAPTGRAAKRLSESTGEEAKTIHRLLEVDPANGKFKRKEDNPLECDLLVADECSMVDEPLAASLLRAVPDRAALIIVGDVDQLPSVGPGSFLSDLIESGAVPVVRLTEIFRQAAASWIIKAAHQINAGEMPLLPRRGEKADFYFLAVDEPEEVAGTIVELVRTRLPRAYGFDPIRDIQVLCPMNRGGAGARAVNDLLQKALNPPGEGAVTKFGETFSLGDKVMQIENDYDRDVYNGDIGFVASVDPEEEELAVNFEGREVKYPFGELDELTLCYATTIHKSQGSEYPVVIIPVTTQHYMMLRRNLIYTGVTRGKRLVVLVGQKKALGIAVRGRQVLRRLTGLEDRLREAFGVPSQATAERSPRS